MALDRVTAGPSVLVLLSGGVDSTLLAHTAKREKRLRGLLCVDYGQPARLQEMAASRECAVRLSAPFFVQRTNTIPTTPLIGLQALGPRVVAGRNLALIAIAVPIAVQYGAKQIWLGANAGDAAEYPDCRRRFLADVSQACRDAYGVGVFAPLLGKTKSEILQEAKAAGITDFWSCYDPGDTGTPCGVCDSCVQADARGGGNVAART